MGNMAKSLAYTILNLTKEGLDRGLISARLWEQCAVPALLYATETMVLSKDTISKLEEAQQVVGRFILQVGRSTARAAIWIDVGLMPMKRRVQQRRLGFYKRLMSKEQEDWA